jgi:hypothetical protein
VAGHGDAKWRYESGIKAVRTWNRVFTAPSRHYRPMMVAHGRPQLNGRIARRGAPQHSNTQLRHAANDAALPDEPENAPRGCPAIVAAPLDEQGKRVPRTGTRSSRSLMVRRDSTQNAVLPHLTCACISARERRDIHDALKRSQFGPAGSSIRANHGFSCGWRIRNF